MSHDMPKREIREKSAAAAASSAPAPPVPEVDLKDSSLYLNRELSLLAFQRRVLEEAEDEANPLLERVKFLAILGSNLDEFFMVRVAGLAAQMDSGSVEAGPDGMSPRAQLVAIRREYKRLLNEAHRCLEKLLPLLQEEGIFIHDHADLNAGQLRGAAKYFANTAFPVLTPLALDPGRPFPHISNLSLNLAVLIRDHSGEERFARVKVPDSLPQLVPLNAPAKANHKRIRPKRVDLVWLEQVIAANLAALFPGMEILESHPFHITRDADMAIKELEAEDLLESVEEGVRQRRFGSPIRLMVTQDMPASVLNILIQNLEITSREVYRTARPLSFKRLMGLYSLERPELKDPPFVPATPPGLAALGEEEDVFSRIRKQDILIHHPFDSFQPVIEFLRKAARDPAVLAIKICLYRVGRNSPVVEALLEAQEGLKAHGKVALVVRREQDRIARYVHISTGNYNAVTAHLYTDIGLFTADEDIADDATDLFNYLTGYSYKSDYKRLLVAPVNLRARLEFLIEREIKHAKAGRKASLIFKVNSLGDPRIIRSLYRASREGVKIQLLVRGICCLRPGVPGISENIEVLSVVGRFLEHSRVYDFHNGGEDEVYIGSADLMSRNIDHRVEVLVPILDRTLVRNLREEVLAVYLADNVKARHMQSNGTYTRKKAADGRHKVDSQDHLLRKRSGKKTKSPRIKLRP